MEELTFDNILSDEEVENIFITNTKEDESPEEGEKNTTENNNTTEVDLENPFSEEPESVGSGNKENQGEEGTKLKSNSISPTPGIYSSIATTLKEEGILSTLDEDTIKELKGAEDLVKAFEKQIQSQLDDRQKRIDEALNNGVNPTEIQKYESTLKYLDDITEDLLKDETDKGEQLRKQLIYQDFVNRGMSKERAQKQMERAISSGTDLEEAQEALASNKEYFNDSYKDLLNAAKEEEEKSQKARKDQADSLKKVILETEEPFVGIKIDKATRQKVLDNLTKPVYKDTEGNWYTPIQKYEMENREEFIKKLGVIFTLTDGFKSLDKVVNQKAQKEIKKSIKDLEHVLSNTSRNSDGTLAFMSGASGDPDSNSSFTLDI